ncbi:MAG: BrnA antitoxin family protein [Chthonomonadaceae bacterium]|nr:BrnA antitoxin family protein [Chthonomonadaceae bacterium]
MNNTSKTNWERIDALTDEQIDTSEIPSLEEGFFAKATLRKPLRGTVAVEIDADTLSWYRAQGEQAQERMAAALRIYAYAHQA